MASGSYSQLIRSVPWRPRDAFLVFLLPWVIIPLGFILWLHILEPYVPALHGYIGLLESSDPKASFGLVIIDAVGSFAIIGYYLRKYRVGLSSLGLRQFNLFKVLGYLMLVIIGFVILIAAAFYVVQLVYPGFNADQPQTNEFTGQTSLLSLIALVILPPLVEETVFRGFIFPAFAKRYGLAIGALATSLLFGVAHLQGNVSVYTFILSLLLCWLYSRTGSIIPGMAIHMLNNYIAYLALNQK